MFGYQKDLNKNLNISINYLGTNYPDSKIDNFDEVEFNLSFEDLTTLLLKGPPLKTYTITIPEGLWISETLETLSAQTGYDVIQLENSLTSGQVISKHLSFQQSQIFSNRTHDLSFQSLIFQTASICIVSHVL